MGDAARSGGLLGHAARRLVRRGLRGVWLAGDRPPGPVVWAANHHCWWDPFVALALLDRPGSPLLSRENADRYRFVRRLGGFAADEPRRGLALLGRGRTLIVYPEGELRPAGPPGPLAGGAAWLARRGGVPLWSAATRVVVRGHQAAEAYVCLRPVPGGGTAALAEGLAADLAALDAAVAAADPRAPLPGYRPAVAGRRSAEELLGRWSRPGVPSPPATGPGSGRDTTGAPAGPA
ncbi:1-acyl-sn-glycerol-3-phosphate acyltransferase [Pilimelia anulata]|uniref:1-acyl-sn-glycerol-3-phosphate acyltransferase n=1 Tax=Pilimelia anulata TaxID=53371 RepID=A0A8J3FB03_9ACTN|nr:lysophospholipid acyltransferase family protein [Pilimelia anulata]GGK02846.1 1-acyl-sn-glycerol-3-phosphate acyltransferase [Pilimelia anulata]